jgi:hypothetical protein
MLLQHLLILNNIHLNLLLLIDTNECKSDRSDP